MNSPNQQQREQKQPGFLFVVLRDAIAVLSIAILLFCIHEFANPFIRGFHCDDETIRYPHKPSTVSSTVCYFVGSGVNILLILVLEYFAVLRESPNREASNTFDTRRYLQHVYCRLIIWFFGSISSELLTDISKVTAGRLRPHFINVCAPMIRVGDAQLSLDEYCKDDSHKYQYITDYYCSSNAPNLRDIRLSFMSGHSSYSAYSAAYAVFYLQSRLDVARVGLLKPGFQVLVASAAFYTGLTRVSDYKHHWQDVLAGLLQGTLVAAVVSLSLFPSYLKSYARYLKNGASPRVGEGDQLDGEELNRVSY